tara:strand:+ start:1864 stop:2094 length:231 start_codon:yes stop_codon:yes gene_type:complete
MADNLNAEIVLGNNNIKNSLVFFAVINVLQSLILLRIGTVTNVTEAIMWLSYSYLYVRMLRNPLVYGVNPMQKVFF